MLSYVYPTSATGKMNASAHAWTKLSSSITMKLRLSDIFIANIKCCNIQLCSTEVT